MATTLRNNHDVQLAWLSQHKGKGEGFELGLDASYRASLDALAQRKPDLHRYVSLDPKSQSRAFSTLRPCALLSTCLAAGISATPP